MNEALNTLNEEFSISATQAEVWNVFKDHMGAYGLEGLNYVNGVIGNLAYFSTLSSEWRAHHASLYAKTDYFARHCIENRTPLLSDSRCREGRMGLDKINMQMLQDVKDRGANCSFCVPLPSFSRTAIAACSFTFDLSDAEMSNFHTEHGADLIMCAYLVNQAMNQREIAPSDEFFRSSNGLVVPKKEFLTDREKDVLRYLAAGLRPDRIGEVMNISTATVNQHIQKARRRLNAKNREQAIVIALLQKQIVL